MDWRVFNGNKLVEDFQNRDPPSQRKYEKNKQVQNVLNLQTWPHLIFIHQNKRDIKWYNLKYHPVKCGESVKTAIILKPFQNIVGLSKRNPNKTMDNMVSYLCSIALFF